MSDQVPLSAQDKKNSTIPRDPVTGHRRWVGAQARSPRPVRTGTKPAGYVTSIAVAGNGHLKRAKKRLMLRGLDVLDKRGPVAKYYAATRQALVEQLGGKDAVTPAQEHLIEIITRGLVYLGHIDAVLLEKTSLLGGTKRRALPLVGERMAYSRIVTQQLALLGLTRVTRIKSLAEDLANSPELLSKEGEPL